MLDILLNTFYYTSFQLYSWISQRRQMSYSTILVEYVVEKSLPRENPTKGVPIDSSSTYCS